MKVKMKTTKANFAMEHVAWLVIAIAVILITMLTYPIWSRRIVEIWDNFLGGIFR